jgi:hypothetical protein
MPPAAMRQHVTHPHAMHPHVIRPHAIPRPVTHPHAMHRHSCWRNILTRLGDLKGSPFLFPVNVLGPGLASRDTKRIF